ncbi:MAG: DUF5013 domain-containing protein [Bacteroidaceae bacterium]|nr:DUF5013 domain-containing protein [Bacteroidaceae bacterium]
MTHKNLFKSIIAVALALPMSLFAQVDVNRATYPDYSDKTNPDWSLMPQRGTDKAQRTGDATRSQRPAYVNNAEQKFFPPVFNQDGGSCGSASRICYMFTYELNAYRNLDGKKAENNYPSHFVWLLTNSSSGKDEFVTSIGVPSSATYGGRTYSSLFGNQDCANNDFGWMQGYNKWFEAMHNRMLAPSNFPVNVGTEEGREAVKNWLWNHNGDTSFKAGGICGIGVASADGNYDGRIPNTTANSTAGVVNKKYVKAWGPQVDHALTIVGYDDRIEFDLDGNGVAGETSKDEVGAWIIVNSWDTWWGNSGFIYCPYAYGGSSFNTNGTFAQNWWEPEIYKVRKDYRPLRTIKLEMEYSRRSEMKLSAGISTDINAAAPEKTIEFEHFKYAGDGNNGNTNPAPEVPMLGRWADGKLHSEPMEFGYDLTDLTEGYDRSMPLKYFFIVETRSWGKGSGKIHNASIIDYEFNLDGQETPFDIGNGVEIRSAGNKTIISVVVYGDEYYAPQNLSLNQRTLSWTSPMRSSHSILKYRIYRNNAHIAEISGTSQYCTIPSYVELSGTFAVSAIYDDGAESQKVTVQAPIANDSENKAINLRKSGLSIPNVFNQKYNELTMEFYIKPNSLKDWNQSAGPGWGRFMMHANANGAFTVGWDTNNRTFTNPGTLKVGVWTHIAFVVKGNSMEVYVNGALNKSFSSSSYSGIGGWGNLVFSASGDSNASDASYDEIRIWNRARTANEIKNSMNAQFAGSMLPNGLIAYYKGDVISENGSTMLRECINSNHATILNNNYSVETSSKSLGRTQATLSANINAVTGDIRAGIPVKLSATYSDAVTRIVWSIPDAGINNVAVASPTVTFTSAGAKSVSITAEDSDGKTVSQTITVTVNEEPEADARFKVSKSPVILGEKVSLIVVNPQLGYKYEWSMPGAEVETAQGLRVNAVYETPGTKIITLKVTSISGEKTATSKVYIDVDNSKPLAAFEINPAVIMKGETTYLTDMSKFGPKTWEWTVESPGKKFVINGQHYSLTPKNSGVYNVTLKVSNNVGSSSTTMERGLIVCNADSKNGLNFSGRENAKVTASVSNAPATASAMTIEWWMRPEELVDNCLALGDSNSTLLLTTKENGTMTLAANGYTTGESLSGFVIAKEWHHYAAVLTGGYVYFYRDGAYYSSRYVSYNAAVNSLSRFAIGNDNARMNGQIDELRVWTKAIKDDELLAICNTPLENPSSQDGLLLYYDFNQSGGDVIDRSGNGNDGVRSGFGPDGDAWGLSKGVFCLHESSSQNDNISADYLTNYRAAFNYNANNQVNTSVRDRFYELTDWTIENTVTSGNVTTGAHVDAEKDYCMTFTTVWDGFSTLNNHKIYQTITLPAGTYTFTAKYHNKWEGQCGNSYIIVDDSRSIPGNASIEDAIAYTKMADKSSTMSNSVNFNLDEETQVSLGLIVNMSDKICMAIESFELARTNTEYIDANGGQTTVEPVIVAVEREDEDTVYDLQGRRITEPQKGNIYIKNGKKFFAK